LRAHLLTALAAGLTVVRGAFGAYPGFPPSFRFCLSAVDAWGNAGRTSCAVYGFT
jgi:hypothetical protein